MAKNKKIIKMTAKEFYTLGNFHFELKILKLSAENEEKERNIKALSKRIMDLEQAVVINNQNNMISKHKQLEKKLYEKREEIAKRLGIDTLDKYFVDDETYVLTHEDNIPLTKGE